ncbi:MAG: PhoU domain-containing protein [Acidimicrobiales bacterium]
MVFRLGSARRGQTDDPAEAVAVAAAEADDPEFVALPHAPGSVLAEIDRRFVQAFALVGEGIAGATHALLAGDREAAKELVQRDEVVDRLTHDIAVLAQGRLLTGDGTMEERRELITVLRMLTDLERNGDLAEHIARRAARGLGVEMSARCRGLASPPIP